MNEQKPEIRYSSRKEMTKMNRYSREIGVIVSYVPETWSALLGSMIVTECSEVMEYDQVANAFAAEAIHSMESADCFRCE